MDGGAWWAAVHGVAKSRTRLSDFTFTFMHWRRKWQPTLQCSCLENPRDRGAWRAADYGVAQSRTRLKRLSSSSRDHSSIPDQRNCPANMQNDEWNKWLLFEAFSLEFCCTVEATWYMRGLTERKIAGSLKDTRNWDLYSQWEKNCWKKSTNSLFAIQSKTG